MIASCIAVLAMNAAALAHAPPTVAQLFQRNRYERVEVSPDGSKLAIAYRVDEGTRVTVIDSATRKPITQVDPGSRGEVGELTWLGNERLLLSANRRLAGYNVSIVEPRLYLVDLHKKHPRILADDFLGTIDGDDRHVLVSSCGNFPGGNCVRRINLLDDDEKSELLATAPKHTYLFSIDHAGTVRFALGWDKNARSRLYLRQGKGKWKLVNDSDVSHVDVIPLGIARDNRSAVLDTEQVTGTDVLERYDFATGKRTPLLHDPDSDPLTVIRSFDGRGMIGAWYGPGRPRARYFMTGVDAKWHQALNKSFPDGKVIVESASDNGNIVVVRVVSDRNPGRFYLLDRATHKLDHLFDARPDLDSKQLLPTRPFTMQARDGLTLHGFVTLPRGVSGHAPMVVIVHGGPYLIRDDWTFDPETQLLATHGYAVLHVNFRGSGGSGLDFVERGYRQWGKAMQNDVTDATRWAIKQGLADPDRICIYGASYGGYAALMGAALQPKLYRCAIGYAGVYDLARLYRWGDIHRSDYGMHYLHTVLGLDKRELAAHSPAELADRIKVPVLLAHGAMDGRVPLKYAREMRHAMRHAGHPVEYLEYSWEGHGLSRRDDIKDFYTHMLDFLHAHLAAPEKANSS
ncbi:alpha/beta fold hydrolase [Oleiagrimonas sp. MCCC 1A03011]|uniref:alpha/beta hydrolase family protein n=1 Tax=Oleiagrimonas sp. MCCC 1A03011 TaxID=1926883 RepID=UPI000DC3D9D6|nr:alpha/beta fold hydrolase [Oleiagrimonas sp. MCCC 1A03011]RAP57098.1 hypothetical protein BTJ49_11015 [Oleiagrimonas sp. MCCC 1A03011]